MFGSVGGSSRPPPNPAHPSADPNVLVVTLNKTPLNRPLERGRLGLL